MAAPPVSRQQLEDETRRRGRFPQQCHLQRDRDDNVGNCHIDPINNFYRTGLDAQESSTDCGQIWKGRSQATAIYARQLFRRSTSVHSNKYAAAIDFEHASKRRLRGGFLDEIRVNREFEIGDARPHTHTAQIAFEKVLSSAGTSLRRDAADARIVQGVRDKTNRLIDSQQQVGGWPALEAGQALSNAGPRRRAPRRLGASSRSNPADPNDGNGDHNHDGFTNLEEYLNSLVR